MISFAEDKMASINISSISFAPDQRFVFGSFTFVANESGRLQLSDAKAPQPGGARSDLAIGPCPPAFESDPEDLPDTASSTTIRCLVKNPLAAPRGDARAVYVIIHPLKEEESILPILQSPRWLSGDSTSWTPPRLIYVITGGENHPNEDEDAHHTAEEEQLR